MAIKKKKASKKTKKKQSKVSKKKRSEAAKKGWETRRRKERDRIFALNNPELVGVEFEIERRVSEELRKRTAKAVVDELTRLGKVEKSREAQIKARLRYVGGPDSDLYYDEVQLIHDEEGFEDMTLNEIYTLGFY
jgi:hypothetical protein